ncbi:hypothetical protein E9993_15750 [Labilibacter sediminis]|nr:hypothetical protein E9993_15750 [Labilibacter sediminis]
MKIYLFILAALALLSGPSFSQGCEESSEESSDEGPKLIGFIQPQYEYHFTDPTTNTLKFKRARLGVTGSIPYDFHYYVMMELSPFIQESENGDPFLLDAFISYRRYDWAKISVGSFKQPFGLEVSTACSGLHTIERSKVSDQLVSPQRDIGLMFFGGNNETLFKYYVAIMNGSGLGLKDNNSKKDLMGRLTIKPLEWLQIGGSFRNGYPRTNDDDTDRQSWAAEVEISKGNFLVQGEYINDKGAVSDVAGGGCGADPVVMGDERGGYWMQGMYMYNYQWQPVIKFEMFDKDKATDNDEEYITTFGLNYFFNDQTRLQLNYQYKSEKAGEMDNDALLVQLQVKF